MEQRIVCAAIRLDNKDIICGVRHHDKIMNRQIISRFDAQFTHKFEQGFVDNKGNFLTRSEAFKIAFKQNQIIRSCGGDAGKLFSENLY